MPTAYDILVARIDLLGETPPGGERPTVTTDHLSGSQIKSNRRCGAAYFFERGLNIPTARGSALIKGSSLHEGIGAGLAWKRDQLAAGIPNPDVSTFLAIALDAANGYLDDEFFPKKDEKPKPPIMWDSRWQKGPADCAETLRHDVARALALFAIEIYPTIIPLRIESGYYIHWKDEQTLPVLGYTDSVHQTARGTGGIIDWKSGTKIKTVKELALDNTLIGYAHGAQLEIDLPIDEITYGCIVFSAPRDKSRDAHIRIEMLPPITFERDRLMRLYSDAREATLARRTGMYNRAESIQTCPGCAFKGPCSQLYGPLDPTILSLPDRADPEAEAEAA